MKEIRKLTVAYADRIVGTLAALDDGTIAFQYEERWIGEGFSISPLSLPLDGKVRISSSPYFEGLFGVFRDSLPDGWGEMLMRRFLRSQGVEYDRLSPLERLALVGANGLGGLSYRPSRSPGETPEPFDLDDLARQIRAILDEKDGSVDLDRIRRLGGSSGGARPKAHLSLDGVAWIVKFPAAFDPIETGTLEFEANRLAREAGIDVGGFALFPSKSGSGFFGSRRFDREEGRRIHVISLSALLETTHRIPNLDYMHLFQVVSRICSNQEDLYEAYRRMCFNVLYGNKDDHGKNHSFLYDEKRGGYRLTPAYDLTRTPDKLEHEMTVLGQGKPQEADLRAIADAAKLSREKSSTILRQVKSALHIG